MSRFIDSSNYLFKTSDFLDIFLRVKKWQGCLFGKFSKIKLSLMFLQLAHTKLDVFKVAKIFVLESYRITKLFPVEEKFAMAQQIRRATLSVLLNITEGCSRKSLSERRRYFEVARGSLIEVDTAFDIAICLDYCTNEDLSMLGVEIIKTFKILSGLIKE